MHLGKRRAKELFDSLWGNRIVRDAAGLLAVSTLEVNQMRSLGIRHDRIHLLPNPIEESAYATMPEPGKFKARWGIDSRSVVLFLGRLNWIKGADLLVKALDRMSDDVHLVLAGPDDGHKSRLNALISNELAKRVTFAGSLGFAEKLEAFVDAERLCCTLSKRNLWNGNLRGFGLPATRVVVVVVRPKNGIGRSGRSSGVRKWRHTRSGGQAQAHLGEIIFHGKSECGSPVRA